MRSAILICMLACSGSAHHDAASGSQAQIAIDAAVLSLPNSGAFQLPADYTRCLNDTDCTIVSLGCCDNTPVNLAHVDATRSSLAASGRPRCPVKAACGPGPSGTWDGQPGACVDRSCTFVALQVPASGTFTLPAQVTACKTDDDCLIVSLGCCDNTPVHRAYATLVQHALETSGRPFCAPKKACGPGGLGTWSGVEGVCTASRCAMPTAAVILPASGPFTLPADYTSCTTDASCVVVSMGCADETAVNRAHAADTRRAFEAAGREYRAPKDACGPGAGGTMDGVAGVCKAGACQVPRWP